MFGRQTTGSVVCRSCSLLVGVNDPECYHCGAKNPGLWGYAPLLKSLGNDLGFVYIVSGGCIILYLLTLAYDPRHIGTGGIFSMLSPSGLYLSEGRLQGSLYAFGAAGAVPVYTLGHWWTLLSAGWLHGGLLHIGLNLYWVFQIAPLTAEMYGAGRTVIIYTVGSVVGFFASSTAGAVIGGIPIIGGAGLTIGASAALFGLFGALVYTGRRGGSSLMSRQIRSLALTLFVFGFLFAGVDNWAHAGGFAGGYLAGRWLDPMTPERLNHLVGAAVCLLASLLAILASLIAARAGA